MRSFKTRREWHALLIIFAASCGCESTVAAAVDSPQLILKHLTTSDGLPQATVMASLQDSQGFVWLGTEDGLVRYDGHELFRYAYSRGTLGGLPGNFIYQLAEDAHHDLWIATKGNGLARWNRATDSFTVWRHDSRNPASIASDAVRTVLVDPRGSVWIGSGDAGIDVLDSASGHIEHLRHHPGDAASLGDDRVQTLFRDRSGALWVGTASGLDRLQGEQRLFSHFRHDAADAHSLSGNLVSTILQDRSGAYWVGSFDGGLDRMDGDGYVSRTFRHDPHQAASLADDDVRAILEDQAGQLWIGTARGLDKLDRISGRMTHYQKDPRDPESLRDSFIMSLYEDPTGLVWIGTREGGVSRWNPRSFELGGHRPDWLADLQVTSFADAPGNRVWIGSMGGGLSLFDPDSGTATHIDALRHVHDSIGDRRVMSLRQDQQGTLWIGTMAAGVWKLAPNGNIEAIPVLPGNPHGLSSAGIMTLYESRAGQIWVGTLGGGANVIEPATGRIRQLPFGDSIPGAISSANVSAVVEDANGNMWIGTDGNGLDLARPDGAVIKVFRHDAADPASMPSNTVYALAIDAQQHIWAATDGGGLAQVVGSSAAPDAIRFQVLSHEQGLSSDTVYGVLADGAGSIWLSGYSGLTRYNPVTHVIKTYHREHGLQGEEFDFNAYFKLRDGRLCFGGPGGFNIFDPARLTESRQPPRLALTRVEIMGVPTPSATPYWLRNTVALDYRQNILSLDFGALDFTSPKLNRLAYRMADLTDRWIDLGTQHRITLTNLDAGDHVLEVRAANSDSVWSPTPLRLIVHRDAAPWKTPWAYSLYALAVLGLLGYRTRLQRIRFQRIVREQQRLESEVALRTRELVDSNHQLEQASRAKSDFMDRMSHELRTPMNGVVGMTELLVRTPLSAAQAKLTQTIRSSAQVLLQIVNDLLDLSKINAGKVQLEALPLQLERILEESTGLFTGTAQAKGIDLIVRPPQGAVRGLRGDPLRVRQILMNLVGNAVKFTAQGAIVVEARIMDVTADRATLHLTVTDSGIGMDEATIGRIFKPFTQADESTTRRFGGTGLGLAICRELAHLMGGDISVISRPGVGSTFHVTLPMNVGTDSVALGDIPSAAPQVGGAPVGGHVLLVEDEPVNAAVAQGYLAALGCTSVWVKDGPEAIARACAESFDLILMDLNMPTMDGFETTALLRQRLGPGGTVPIIAMTAHNSADYREKCLQASLNDMLSKPCTLEECERVLRRWIRSPVVRAPAAGVAPCGAGLVALELLAAAPPARKPEETQAPAQDVIAPGLDHAEGAAHRCELSRVDAAAVARLRKLRGAAQGDLYAKLVDLFQSCSRESMTQLRREIVSGDLRAAAKVCHKLASSAANVGALPFARDVRRLEQLCNEGHAPATIALLQRLAGSYPMLMEELRAVRTRASA